MASKLIPPLKWHGGKQYLAKKIIALMPPRCKTPNAPAPDDSGWLHYVEPYAGGLAVLLANEPEGISEVVNDLNGPLTAFWQTLMNPAMFAEFHRHVEAMPFSEELYDNAADYVGNVVVNSAAAAAFFVACRQSLSGRMKGFASITRARTRRGMNEQVSAWLNAIEGLPAVHARLKRVLVLNRPALDVIKSEDGPRTLYYLDPPYMHETRATTGEYEHEMTREDHAKLLNALQTIKGRFLLSGYHSGMYDRAAAENGWRCHNFDLPNNSAGGKAKRRMTEAVWKNY